MTHYQRVHRPTDHHVNCMMMMMMITATTHPMMMLSCTQSSLSTVFAGLAGGERVASLPSCSSTTSGSWPSWPAC